MNWEWSAFAVTFTTVFLAELGDKTQLVTVSMRAKGHPFAAVFIGAASALVVSSLLGTLAGGLIGRLVPPAVLSRAAAALFILLGIAMLFKKM